VEVDRKVLADIAVRSPDSFEQLIHQAQSALAAS
jgi:ribosomal protein L20